MNSFSRFSAILFALMLTFVGIGRNQHEALFTSVLEATAGEQSSSQLAEKKLNDVYCSQPQAEHVVSPVSNLPVPGSKIHPYDFLGGAGSVELRLRNLVAYYLAYARTIIPGTSVRVIIFPFHHFW